MLAAFLEHAVVALLLAILTGLYLRRGRDELLRVILVGLRYLPGVQELVDSVIHREAVNFINEAGSPGNQASPPRVLLPEKGISHDELRSQLSKMRQMETNPQDGKIFAYVYTLEDDHFELQADCFDNLEETTGHSVDHDAFIREANRAFMHENALNPMVFPSLRRMETEIVSMTAGMLNAGAEAVGFVTSGGTESVLMAVKTFRDRARHLAPHIKFPEIVAPVTAHPVLDKAGHYFGVKVIHTPVGPDYRADVRAMAKAITNNTILLVASAPQFCHGVVDPIEEISELSTKRGIPVHIDACFGGFMLPWVEKLGYEVPKWDFRVPGVMSISADTHKYGYSIKGSSVIVYRNAELRRYQIFTYAEWPGGLYGSPSMAGTRPGGNIAATWASMKALGVEGYMTRAKELMDITNTLKQGIARIDNLGILGQPHMTSFAFQSKHPDVNIFTVADIMEKKGWKMERQQKPDSLHCSILPHHKYSHDRLLADLAASTQEAKGNHSVSKTGSAAVYGMVTSIPDKAIINDFLVEFFSETYKVK